MAHYQGWSLDPRVTFNHRVGTYLWINRR